MRFNLQSALAIVIASAALSTGLFGCDQITDAVAQKAKEEAGKVIQEQTDKAVKAIASSPAAAVVPDLFADASSIPTKLKEKIGGPVRILELVVYPGYAIAKIQDPNKKLEANEFTLRNGVVGEGVPLKFTGTQPTEKDLLAETFDVSEIDFAKVPTMAKEAPAKVEVPDGKVTHMVMKRDKDIGWRVFVNGARKDGWLDYDAKGGFKKKG